MMPPAIVAAAYKKIAGDSTYNLSQPKLSPLKSALTVGEAVSSVISRINKYQRIEIDDDETAYIDYSLFGTIVCVLAGTLPLDFTEFGAALFDYLKAHAKTELPQTISSYKGYPKPSVRLALYAILRAIRPDLFFEMDLTDARRSEILAAASGLEGDADETSLHEALDLLEHLSHDYPTIMRCLRAASTSIPTDLAIRFFSASLRSYPTWLHSATIEAAKEGKSTVVGDLRDAIVMARRQRHKTVNVLSLNAYEQAGNWLFKTKSGKCSLISMFVIPLRRQIGSHEYVGLLRFMNRYYKTDNVEGLYIYERKKENAEWIPTDEEVLLGAELLNLLGDALPDIVRRRGEKETEVASIKTAATPKIGRFTRDEKDPFSELIGESETWRRCIAAARAVAALDDPVLLVGETGTGKNMLARAIHDASKRNGCFEEVIVGGSDREDFGGKIFGLGRGYPDAPGGTTGLALVANNGTLFLNEIGDLSVDIQVTLNAFIENGLVRRKAEGDRSFRSTARIIAATNAPLNEMRLDGRFRPDLYFRLCRWQIEVPPIREREDDVLLFYEYYRRQYLKNYEIDADVKRIFLEPKWPGNIREVEAVIAKIYRGAQTEGVKKITVEMVRKAFII